jgi:hypothetical protein
MKVRREIPALYVDAPTEEMSKVAKIPPPTVEQVEEFIRSQGPDGCPKTLFDSEYRHVSEIDRDALIAISGKIVKVRGLVKGVPANIYKLTGGEDRLSSPSLPVTKMFDGPPLTYRAKKDQQD